MHTKTANCYTQQGSSTTEYTFLHKQKVYQQIAFTSYFIKQISGLNWLVISKNIQLKKKKDFCDMVGQKALVLL